MTVELERIEMVAGQVPLPGMTERQLRRRSGRQRDRDTSQAAPRPAGALEPR